MPCTGSCHGSISRRARWKTAVRASEAVRGGEYTACSAPAASDVSCKWRYLKGRNPNRLSTTSLVRWRLSLLVEAGATRAEAQTKACDRRRERRFSHRHSHRHGGGNGSRRYAPGQWPSPATGAAPMWQTDPVFGDRHCVRCRDRDDSIGRALHRLR
jgi:hypothetical protein